MSNETKTALDVCEGDVVFVEGYRCIARNVRREEGSEPIARYDLESAPNENHKQSLPRRFEGMTSGGNRLARVAIEGGAPCQ